MYLLFIRELLPYVPSPAGEDGRGLLHTTLNSKRSCNCRENSDEDLEYLTPDVFRICVFHSLFVKGLVFINRLHKIKHDLIPCWVSSSLDVNQIFA